MVSAYRRASELSRSLVAEGMRELCDPEVTVPLAFEPAPSRLAEEYEAALEQLRMQAASKRWRIAAASRQLEYLHWWSLEDACPYWW